MLSASDKIESTLACEIETETKLSETILADGSSFQESQVFSKNKSKWNQILCTSDLILNSSYVNMRYVNISELSFLHFLFEYEYNIII